MRITFHNVRVQNYVLCKNAKVIDKITKFLLIFVWDKLVLIGEKKHQLQSLPISSARQFSPISIFLKDFKEKLVANDL